jgi:hypothetical protein
MVYPGLIGTGMFSGVKQKMEFLTPPLKPTDVSNAIIDTFESGRSREVGLPAYVSPTAIFRIFPLEFVDWFKEFIGANDDMKGWTHSVSSQ